MEYIENDNEIIFMINDSGDEATEYLINKYKNIIEYFVEKYRVIASKVGFDKEDLYQEGLFGLIEAIKKYNEYRDVKFKTFASSIIKNHILKIIESGSRLKNRVLNESLSLEYEYDDNISLEGLIGTDITIDKILINEKIDEINMFIDNNLKDRDKKILLYRVNGFSKEYIANLFDTNVKSIDNSLYRSKKKIKLYMSKLNENA